MKITQTKISVKDLTENYINNEDGCWGLNKKLNIRPAYQREFVYKDAQRDAVINSVRANFPLNTFYWSKNSDGTYEVLDGQQRTLSICQYVNKEFSINHQFFHNLTKEEQQQIFDYQIDVYVCEGSEKEKLDWFKVINIAGEKLTDQELRNAIYTGPWLSDAKKYFSKQMGPAYNLAKDYIKGSPIRQEYLETAINWISNNCIEQYMATHQNDQNANQLWLYFQKVINWIPAIFPKYRKEMKGVDWGRLYNLYNENDYNTDILESEVKKLMMDDDVTKKSGIYEYLLSGKKVEKVLSIRSFTESQKRVAYEKQNGVCPICGKKHDFDEMEADHITPWSLGGKTIPENLQMICKSCNRTKSNK